MSINYFREFSSYTDPGEYALLFENLPTSLEDISDLVHAQLIHPGRKPDLVTKANEKDEETCETVHAILAKLQERFPIGLSLERKPEHRVVNNCCGHSQLMASILKSRGSPARIRCGFSLYPFKGYSCDHTILETWIDGQWRLIDASDSRNGTYFKLYEIEAEVFHFGWQAWQRTRQGIDDINRYCVAPGFLPGGDAWELVRKALIRDLLCLFGHEMQCWYGPPFKDMADEDIYPTLDQIAELMASPDEQRDKLEKFYHMLDLKSLDLIR